MRFAGIANQPVLRMLALSPMSSGRVLIYTAGRLVDSNVDDKMPQHTTGLHVVSGQMCFSRLSIACLNWILNCMVNYLVCN